MLNMKAFALIATLATAAVSKPVYVFDNAMDFSKFMTDGGSAHMLGRNLAEADDGDASQLGATMNVDSCPGSFTCEWSCEFSGDLPSTPPPVTCPEVPVVPKPPVEEGDFVKSLSDLSTRSVYCLVNNKSGKVLALNKQNFLQQTDSTDCADATRFMFKTLEPNADADVVVARIYSEESFKALQPVNNRKQVLRIITKPLEMGWKIQKWNIVKSAFATDEATWFHVQSFLYNYALDVKGGGSGVADIITYPLHKGSNQAFGFKVVENL